jgi:mannose-6-phosphate isomerase
MPDVPFKVEKPWGHELIWAHTDRYVGKILHVKAGHVLSIQYHERKDETMHVLSGAVILRLWADAIATPVERIMRPGESVHLSRSRFIRSRRSRMPTCWRHRPRNSTT